MIKLEALRTFITVAKAGNIAVASEQLGRTPSAISMTLKALEESIGGPLFETERKNALSPLGQFTYEVATDQVHSFDNAIAKIDDYANSKTGRISISCVPSAAIHIMPKVLHHFRESRPNVQVELHDMDAHSVFAALQSGVADIGIAGYPPSEQAFDFEPLFQDHFVVLYNPSFFNLPQKEALEWGDILSFPMIVNGAADMIKAEAFNDLAKKSTLTVRNISSLLAIVRSGLGITVLPALTVLDLPPDLHSVPMADITAKRMVGLVKPTHRSDSPLITSFRESLLASLPSIASQLAAIDLIEPETAPEE